MGEVKDGAAGGLIDAARLHAHKAVFDQVDPADAMLAAELVQRAQDVAGAEFLAVDRDAIARDEFEFHVLGLVRCRLGRDAELEHVRRRLDPWVFQDTALEADVEQVAVGAVGLLRAHWHGDAFRLRVFHEIRAALEFPVAPRGDDLEVGSESGEGQLEADLVVALAGRAMGDGIGVFKPGDFDLTLGDQRAGDAGAEEILVLIKGVGADHRVDEIAGEFFREVVDVALRRAGLERLFIEALELLLLADIGTERDDLRVIFFLQPNENDGGIESTGISDNNLHPRFLEESWGKRQKFLCDFPCCPSP